MAAALLHFFGATQILDYLNYLNQSRPPSQFFFEIHLLSQMFDYQNITLILLLLKLFYIKNQKKKNEEKNS